MNEFDRLLKSAANRLAADLSKANLKIVFAESCSCGLAASSLGQIPGISQHLCGSFVTYRNSVKTDWLGVEPAVIEKYSATSLETSEAMAVAALQKTLEADISVAVTGHLGPDSTHGLDGLIFVALNSREIIPGCPILKQITLESTHRTDRQLESVARTFELTSKAIHGLPARHPRV